MGMADAGRRMSDVEVLVAGTRRTHARDTETPTYTAAVFVSFNRAWGLFQSMKTLLAYRFAEEAAALGRPMMEESLRLMELASGDDLDRAALALGWLNESAVRRLELIQEARESGQATKEEEKEAKEFVRQRQKDIAKYQNRLGIPKLRKFPKDWRILADNHGRRDEFWGYLLMQHMVHGGELSQLLRTRREANSTVGFHDRTIDQSMIDSVAWSGSQSMLYAHIATCQIFGWPESANGEQLLAQIQAEMTEQSGSS
jgi:hypothetical protein